MMDDSVYPSVLALLSDAKSTIVLSLSENEKQISLWFAGDSKAAALSLLQDSSGIWLQSKMRLKYKRFSGDLSASLGDSAYQLSGRFLYELPCACINIGAEYTHATESQNLQLLLRLPERF